MTDAPRLYYLDDIPVPYRLGVQRHAAQLWGGRFKLAFCAAEEPGRAWSFDFAGLDVEILGGRQYRPAKQVNPMSVKWNPGIMRSLAAFRPDVVVLSGYVHPTMHLAARWCRRNGVPYGISSESSPRNSTTKGWKWQFKRLIAGNLVRRMAFGLPVGREAGEFLKTLGADCPMFYFPNTPDTSVIAREAELTREPGREAALREALGLQPESRIVVFVGRLIDAKRPLDLVRAFGRVGPAADGTQLVIVGDGPLMSELRAVAAGDPRIVFTGWLRNSAQIAGLMALASLMVLPSQHETWGAVVNEAMAAGTAVVATDRVGAAVELIESGVNGIVYPVGDVEALVLAMRALLTDAEQCRRMGLAAQAAALAKGHVFAAENLIAAARHGLARRAARIGKSRI